MSDDQADSPRPAPPPKVAPERLELRAQPRPVTRLSRRALIALGSGSSLIIGGLAIWALSTSHNGGKAPEELYSTERKPVPEGLNTLPRDYTGVPAAPPPGVPQLGPPLPGDLGRPMLSAGQQGTSPIAPGSPPAATQPGPTPEEQARLAEIQRLRQEAETARRSGLFVQVAQRTDERPATGDVASGGDAPRPGPFAAVPGSSESARSDETFTQNGQDRKTAFLSSPTDTKIYASGKLQTPVSPNQVMAGTIISAAMVTGLNSDLPGQAIASVTEPVYDTVTGKTLLIPQGARLLGTYDAQVAYGQSRVLLVWTRLIMPDGSSIVLDRLSGTDAKGFAGLEDETDNHWGKLLAGAALSTLLGVGAELGSGNRGSIDGTDTVVVATGRSAENSVNQVGQQITRRNLNIQPTLTVRPGLPVRVIVNKDMVLRPYGTATRIGGGVR